MNSRTTARFREAFGRLPGMGKGIALQFKRAYPEDFGLVTLDRQPKKAHAAMQRLWRAEID